MSNQNDRAIIYVPAYEDILDRIASFESFRIKDRVYSADLLIPQLMIDSKDLISECAAAAAFSLYWGLQAAQARRWKAQVEAAYRMWRDRTWLEIKASPVPETGKMPTDATVERLLRTGGDYGVWRGKLDDAQEAAEMSEAVHEAFRLKVDLLKTQERIMSHEAGGPYVVMERNAEVVGRQPQTENQE